MHEDRALCSQLTGPSSVFKHVTARRVVEREMGGAAYCGGCAYSAGPLRKPGGPVHPPASIVLGRILPPSFGRFESRGWVVLRSMVFAMSARFDPNGIVEMSAEQVKHVEIAEKPNHAS
jgi:hypothetical protein